MGKTETAINNVFSLIQKADTAPMAHEAVAYSQAAVNAATAVERVAFVIEETNRKEGSDEAPEVHAE